jgi:hypothetical protein
MTRRARHDAQARANAVARVLAGLSPYDVARDLVSGHPDGSSWCLEPAFETDPGSRKPFELGDLVRLVEWYAA